jgi:hypothetical protein
LKLVSAAQFGKIRNAFDPRGPQQFCRTVSSLHGARRSNIGPY